MQHSPKPGEGIDKCGLLSDHQIADDVVVTAGVVEGPHAELADGGAGGVQLTGLKVEGARLGHASKFGEAARAPYQQIPGVEDAARLQDRARADVADQGDLAGDRAIDQLVAAPAAVLLEWDSRVATDPQRIGHHVAAGLVEQARHTGVHIGLPASDQHVAKDAQAARSHVVNTAGKTLVADDQFVRLVGSAGLVELGHIERADDRALSPLHRQAAT